MRLVIQRVEEANVEVEHEIVGKIGAGLLVFLGIHQDDQPKQTEWLVSKMLNLRIFENESGKMNSSVLDIKGEVLVISQFTLYGNCNSGRRPDFLKAASPSIAEPMYNKFVEEVKNLLGSVQTGRFGAFMQVSLVNNGPVTMIIDG
jgi:D-aminoacyl-tRNA deacylase